jgi:hypothetical protein
VQILVSFGFDDDDNDNSEITCMDTNVVPLFCFRNLDVFCTIEGLDTFIVVQSINMNINLLEIKRFLNTI